MFRQSNLAWLLMCIPVFLVVVFISKRVLKSRLQRFIGSHDTVLVRRFGSWVSWVKGFFWFFGFLFLVGALMRPHYGASSKKIERKGHDVFIVMDTSKSMLAKDVQPSRLAFAQAEVKALVEELKGDRLGLIVFEGEAFVQCPLTLDYSAFSLFLDEVSVGLMSKPGTNLSRAIEVAIDNFSKKSKAKEKIIVVFSDGESFEGDPVLQAKTAADAGVVIYTVALGSSTGEPIPIYQGGQLVGYKKDKQGQVVLSKTNVGLLKEVAEATNGQGLEGNNYGVSDELSRLISKRDMHKLGATTALSYNEKYQPFLLMAFLCFSIAFFIPTVRPQRYFGFKKVGVIVVCFLMFNDVSYGATFLESYRVKKGNQAYSKDALSEAELYYSKAKSKSNLAEADQNLGLVYTQTQRYDDAEKAFLASTTRLSGAKKSEAFYNLGNSYFYQEKWQNAVDAYRSALRLSPKDVDAKRNLELALTRLKNDKKKQKKQSKNDQKKDQKQQEKGSGKGNDQNQGNQNQGAEQAKREQKQKAASDQLRFLDQKEKEARKRYKQRVVRESSVEKDW